MGRRVGRPHLADRSPPRAVVPSPICFISRDLPVKRRQHEENYRYCCVPTVLKFSIPAFAHLYHLRYHVPAELDRFFYMNNCL